MFHAGAQLAFRAVVGGFDLAAIVAKGEKLVARPPNLGLQGLGEAAIRVRREKVGEPFLQLPFFPGQGRSGAIGDPPDLR